MEPARERLKEVIDRERLPAETEELVIIDQDAARRERFLGSPTIQINGLDIEASRRGDAPFLGCRLYRDGSKTEPAPPERMMLDAIRRAMAPNPKVLFLCTGNSCRSQMAEGWARRLRGDMIEAYSAGFDPHGVDPKAVKVMAEAGVDISTQRSKNIEELRHVTLDCVITLCGHANELCPFFPGKVLRMHAGFDDPPRLAAAAKTEEEALIHYRRIRDEIRAFVETLPEAFIEG
jgi:arsenate reductase